MKSLVLLPVLVSGIPMTCGDGDGSPPAAKTFTVRIDNVAPWTVLKSGAQTMKTDGMSGPAGSGQSFEIAFTAGKGQAVSFVSMLGESNDWFFAPGPAGIALHDAEGMPVTGDVTAQVALWNAGTEVDQEPGVGADTGPHQMTPEQGAPDGEPTVRELGAAVMLADGSAFMVPAIATMLKATLMYQGNQMFSLRIENVSTDTTLQTSQGARSIHLSPPLWALHLRTAPLFTPGSADRDQGLEEIAESGNTARLLSSMAALSGPATPLSPLLAVVHDAGEPLYSLGQPDRGQGLEALAESGNTATLAMSVAGSQVVNTPVGASMPGPAVPGQAFEFTITAKPGDRLSFATMFGMSNDWLFGTAPKGLPLFDHKDRPVRGDVTSLVALFDAGTEVNQEPAIGPDTGPQQTMPNQGALDPMPEVRNLMPPAYGHPVSAHLRVTLTPM